jgi:hypothetical protein
MVSKNIGFLKIAFVVSATMSLMLAGIAGAQSVTPINPSLVATQGKTAQDFVPKGWTMQDKVEGDINGDNKPDTVLTLTEAGTKDERARALVILLKGPDGKLQRLAIASKLLLCSSCGGALSGPDGPSANIEIKKGVITVSQLSGSRFAYENVNRFWIDKSSKRVVLIGKDIREFDRGNGDETLTSNNYLTGQKIVQTYKAQKLISTKKSTIPKTKQFIEAINIEADFK